MSSSPLLYTLCIWVFLRVQSWRFVLLPLCYPGLNNFIYPLVSGTMNWWLKSSSSNLFSLLSLGPVHVNDLCVVFPRTSPKYMKCWAWELNGKTYPWNTSAEVREARNTGSEIVWLDWVLALMIIACVIWSNLVIFNFLICTKWITQQCPYLKILLHQYVKSQEQC